MLKALESRESCIIKLTGSREKPVFRVSDRALHKRGCMATEYG